MKMEKKDKIKKLRNYAGLTVKELATLLGFKSDSSLKKWESGARVPDDEVMEKIIEICSIDKEKKESKAKEDKKDNEVLEEYKEDGEEGEKEEYKVNKDKEEKEDKEEKKEIKVPQKKVYDEKFIKRNLQLRESYSEKLNNTAYWDRKSLKDVLDEALTMYFESRGK